MAMNPPQATADHPANPLLDILRDLITQARQQVLRHVDVMQVQTYWQIGRHIVEFEQGGQARAAYGKRLLPQLGQALSREFGKGFDASNLRYMRLFYQAFPKCDALRHELSWTHYRLLLGLPDTGRLLESDLERALMDKLQQFLLELGGRALPSSAGSSASAPRRKTSTSTWSSTSTTTCSSVLC